MSVAVANADASNRESQINTTSTLVAALSDVFLDTFSAPSFITVNELGKQAATAFTKRLEDYSYAGITARGAYPSDHTVLLWDSSRFSPREGEDTDVGYLGKYVGQTLNKTGSRSDILAVGVHLPARKGKQDAINNLIRYIEEKQADVDGGIISGDWNLPPHKIEEHFCSSEYTILLTCEDPKTSRSGIIDNVVVFGSVMLDLQDKLVLGSSLHPFTHNPVKGGMWCDE